MSRRRDIGKGRKAAPKGAAGTREGRLGRAAARARGASEASGAERISSSALGAHDSAARIAEGSGSVGSASRQARLAETASGAAKGGSGRVKDLGQRSARRAVQRAMSSEEAVSEATRELTDDATEAEYDADKALADAGSHITRRMNYARLDVRYTAGRKASSLAAAALVPKAREVGPQGAETKDTEASSIAEDSPAKALTGVKGKEKGKGGKVSGKAEREGMSRKGGDASRRRRGVAASKAGSQRGTTRAIASRSVARGAVGLSTDVPLTPRAALSRLARRGVPVVMASAAKAAAAAAALVSSLLPVILPIALVIVLVSSMAGLFTASSQTANSGGDRIAAVAEAEYQSGVAAGNWHHDDPKYWNFVKGDGFVPNDGGAATPWCACFVSWCADQCGLIADGIVPILATASHDDWYAAHPQLGTYGMVDASYVAKPGDFFIYNSTPNSGEHVGLVTVVEPDGSFWTVEGNTSGPYGDGKSQVNRKRHAKMAGGGYEQTNWGAPAAYARPNYPSSVGSVIDIPAPNGDGGFTVTCYDDWFEDWAGGTGQRKVADEWDSKGRQWVDDIAVIDGRYLVACTTTFGQVGDRLTFYLEDGTTIPCIMADAKSGSDPGCNQWGHNDGHNVLEFEVKSARYYRNGNPGTSSWKAEWGGKRVVRCVNESRAAGTGGSSQGVIQAALSVVGKPYVTGASGPDEFDCSGLVWWAYQQAGVSIPRGQNSSRNGYDSSMAGWVHSKGAYYTDPSQAQAGDLLFWGSDWRDTTHVALCIGDGKIVHADGSTVSIDTVFYSSGSFCFGGPVV